MMKLFGHVKQAYSELRESLPGQRFQDYYRRRKKAIRAMPPWKNRLIMGTGFLLICGGVLSGFLPLLPGFVLLLPGLAIVLARWNRGARAMDRVELKVRRLFCRRGNS